MATKKSGSKAGKGKARSKVGDLTVRRGRRTPVKGGALVSRSSDPPEPTTGLNTLTKTTQSYLGG
jgi:hypothetical protein